MRINGVEVEERTLEIGDTVEIDRQLLLLCTERPVEMPALRHATAAMPFGERDADGILGESPAAWALRDALAYARAGVGHVLIMGESGTGKEPAGGVPVDRELRDETAIAGVSHIPREAGEC